MERIILNPENKNFIGCWKSSNTELFNKLIFFFENHKELQQEGVTSAGLKSDQKKTTDIKIDPVEVKNKPEYSIFNEYFNELNECFLDYKKQWPFLNELVKSVDIPSFNLQKYNPGDHFSKIHCERDKMNLHRVFAWMTYLNTTENNEGSTIFSHYELKVKPEIGKTLIWPAEWTHAHAGEKINKGLKYIITGWMHFTL